MLCLIKIFSSNDEIRISDMFLDADERYQVFEVKAAERSHLLHFSFDENKPKNDDDDATDNTTTTQSLEDFNSLNKGASSFEKALHMKCEQNEKEEEKDEKIELPLIDGCDIAGWRKEGLMACSDHQQGALNIGLSSTMFRRESQWPIPFSNSSNSQWFKMKHQLSHAAIRRPAPVIDHDEYAEYVTVHCVNGSIRQMTKFSRDFEEKNVPAIITNSTRGWLCVMEGDKAWTFENLLCRFGNVNWRFSDTHGAMMCMDTYAKYINGIEGMLDDSPLGIYDSEFGDLVDYNDDEIEESSPTHILVHEYNVPSCFSYDLFELAEKGSRPPYRWILIGPERSGTGMHIDPLYTNAWVTVIQGKKRWMLFPPSVPLEKIGMVEGKPQINSATWFKNYYDIVTAEDWPDEWRPVEVLQQPNETVFVPNGWPHLVLNLELTVAVTHNYASEYGPFERMWEAVRDEEAEFSERWYHGLKRHRPDLVERLSKL